MGGKMRGIVRPVDIMGEIIFVDGVGQLQYSGGKYYFIKDGVGFIITLQGFVSMFGNN